MFCDLRGHCFIICKLLREPHEQFFPTKMKIQLTRTNLELVPSSKTISFCRNQILEKAAEEKDSLMKDLSLIYLDSDICVSMTGGDKDNLQVYTKNDVWIKSRRAKVSDGVVLIFTCYYHNYICYCIWYVSIFF